MHVLIIPSEQFVPPHDHMAGTFQLDQARVLKNAGYEVRVISIALKFSLPMILKSWLFKMFGKKSGNATDQYSSGQLVTLLKRKLWQHSSFINIDNIEGIPVYRNEGFYVRPPSGRHDHRWWVKAGLVAFEKYIEDNGTPDIIHAHNALYAGLLADKLKEKYKVPYVLTEHSSYYARKLYHPSLLSKAGKVFTNATPVMVVSNFLGKGLQDVAGKQVQYKVLPNVAEPAFEEKELSQDKKDNFLFVSIGSLIPLKQHASLIKAFHEAFGKEQKVKLEIIGDGEEEASLKELISKYGENDRIFLKGRYTKKQVLDKLNAACILCLQSEYETFGVVILESLLRGVPVITTQCGGPDDIVGPQDGITVPVSDKEALKNALITARNNYNKYDPVAIRENAIKRFGAAAFTEQVSAIYKERINS